MRMVMPASPFLEDGSSKKKDIKFPMENLIKLFNNWEIQLLLLLSFAIQIFLFFTGGLRQRNTNVLLRFSIWMAYLGADFVAFYALGYLSRHVDAIKESETLWGTHPLSFFWAPFLLVHLGGQDTITAFSMEDNSLWSRHLLYMVMQVVLTLYVFWKSIGKHNMELLVSGVFVFVAGVIKYGERVWSLECGSMESLKSSSGNQYMHRLPELTDGHVSYPRTVCSGLRSMTNVLNVFTDRSLEINVPVTEDKAPSLVEIELGILYNDLYTKSRVMRTRTGIILRCISQIAAVVAFVLFLADGKQGYNGIDVAITYSLFIGNFFLEVCAIFNFMKSPWTWAWFKARDFDSVARFSWCLFSNDSIGWERQRSTVVGQYNLRGWLMRCEEPTSLSNYLMSLVKKLVVIFFCMKEEKLFWLSKLLFSKYAMADEMMRHIVSSCFHCGRVGLEMFTSASRWPHLGPYIDDAVNETRGFDFGYLIVLMHMATENHLSKHCSHVDGTGAYTQSQAKICRQQSRYMMYLLANHPSLLPLIKSEVATLEEWQAAVENNEFMTKLESLDPPASIETLEEFKDIWSWLIIYAAAKQDPEMNAAQLARGAKPLTFIRLLLAHLRWEGQSILFMYLFNDRSIIFRLRLKAECGFPDPSKEELIARYRAVAEEARKPFLTLEEYIERGREEGRYPDLSKYRLPRIPTPAASSGS